MGFRYRRGSFHRVDTQSNPLAGAGHEAPAELSRRPLIDARLRAVTRSRYAGPVRAELAPRVIGVADESHWWAWAALAIAVPVLIVIIVGVLLGYW